MISSALKQLILGILFWGAVFQAGLVWFAGSRLFFSVGLWIGIGIAVFVAWHISYSLDRALDMQGEGDAAKYMYRMYAIRIAVVLAAFVLTVYFEIGSMAGVLFGMFSLKLGAYLQPLFEKIKNRRSKEGE